MANELTVSSSELATQKSSNNGSLVLGAGLGGCPRIEVVARESCFESDFSIF